MLPVCQNCKFWKQLQLTVSQISAGQTPLGVCFRFPPQSVVIQDSTRPPMPLSAMSQPPMEPPSFLHVNSVQSVWARTRPIDSCGEFAAALKIAHKMPATEQ